jgi:2-octaprenyl-6-methoxyphenol hydroxylase
MNESTPLKLAVIGAGPVGLALALHAAATLVDAEITLFDARPLDQDVSGDPRTLALSLGTVQLLQRLGAWRPESAQPISEVHVSQDAPSLIAALAPHLAEPELTIRAIDEAVPMLGAVLSYGQVVATLQSVWRETQARAPTRLFSRFGANVSALKNLAAPAGVEVDAGVVERFDLAVVAEGGVFSNTEKAALVAGERRPALRHDYGQTAWVGVAEFVPQTAAAPPAGVAYERFTRHGPAALLPLKDGRAGLVWCTDSRDDPVRDLDDAQRVAVVNTIFHPRTPRLAHVTPMKAFPLRTRRRADAGDRRTVASATPRRRCIRSPARASTSACATRSSWCARWQKPTSTPCCAGSNGSAPDRWAMIAATDFLARSFTWVAARRRDGARAGIGAAALAVKRRSRAR